MSLADIANPRLLGLKEKTLCFNFKVVHVPGREHCGPDYISKPGSTASWGSLLPTAPTLQLSSIVNDANIVEHCRQCCCLSLRGSEPSRLRTPRARLSRTSKCPTWPSPPVGSRTASLTLYQSITGTKTVSMLSEEFRCKAGG